MKKAILQVIEEALPAQTAGEMKKFIEGAELTDRVLRETQAELEEANKVILDYRTKDAQYESNKAEKERLVEERHELEQRKAEQDVRERDFKLELAELRIELMDKNMTNMQSLVSKVFGHPRVTVDRSTEHPYTDQYGNRTSDYAHDNETRTESKE